MKPNPPHNRAFTFIELLVVVAIIAALVILRLPTLAGTKANVQRINCSNNLKKVGIAFRSWADNRNGRMPMAVATTQGGALSAVGYKATGATFVACFNTTDVGAAGKGGVYQMFAVMSNELTTPKILYCPAEYRPNIQRGSVFGNTVGTNTGFFSDNGASYFVGVDANTVNPNMLLTGDHNLGDTGNPPTTAQIYGDGKGNFISLGTNGLAATWVGWADNQHAKQGNVAFADGSVQNLTTTRLHEALSKTGDFGRSAGSFISANGSIGSTGANRLQFP